MSKKSYYLMMVCPTFMTGIASIAYWHPNHKGWPLLVRSPSTDHRGQMRYRNLAPLVKTSLIRDQGNADSGRSLSVETNVVTKARAGLYEQNMFCLRSVKEVVCLYDPDHLRHWENAYYQCVIICSSFCSCVIHCKARILKDEEEGEGQTMEQA